MRAQPTPCGSSQDMEAQAARHERYLRLRSARPISSLRNRLRHIMRGLKWPWLFSRGSSGPHNTEASLWETVGPALRGEPAPARADLSGSDETVAAVPHRGPDPEARPIRRQATLPAALDLNRLDARRRRWRRWLRPAAAVAQSWTRRCTAHTCGRRCFQATGSALPCAAPLPSATPAPAASSSPGERERAHTHPRAECSSRVVVGVRTPPIHTGPRREARREAQTLPRWVGWLECVQGGAHGSTHAAIDI